MLDVYFLKKNLVKVFVTEGVHINEKLLLFRQKMYKIMKDNLIIYISHVSEYFFI